MLDKYSHNTFFLIRHGESENNVLGLISSVGGKREYALTERGRKQVVETARFLKSQKLDFMVSSPVMRAKETATILQETLGIPLSLDERLCESHFGSFEEVDIDTFLDYMKEHGGRLHGQMSEGIEGYLDIRERVKGFLLAVSESFTGKQIVIVSHGDPLQEMYGELMGLTPEDCEGDGSWYPKKGSCMLVSKEKNEEYVPKS